MRLNALLVRSTLVGALGGLLFGFDTAVISGTTHQLTQVFGLSAGALGLTVSIALWGTVIGAIGAGPLGQKIGGREALRIMAILYVVSALGCALAWNWPSLLCFRLIGGLGIGGSSVLGPVYLAELAPARLRGRLVGLFQINIVAGILLAYASNYAVAQFIGGAAAWRWQFGVATLPAIFFALFLFGIPRSSRWLVTQNRIDEARRVLEMMGTPNSEAELQRNRRLHPPRARAKIRAPVPAQIPPAHFPRHLHRHVQPARRHQRHPLLRATTFSASAASPRSPPTSKPSCSAR